MAIRGSRQWPDRDVWIVVVRSCPREVALRIGLVAPDVGHRPAHPLISSNSLHSRPSGPALHFAHPGLPGRREAALAPPECWKVQTHALGSLCGLFGSLVLLAPPPEDGTVRADAGKPTPSRWWRVVSGWNTIRYVGPRPNRRQPQRSCADSKQHDFPEKARTAAVR